MAEEALYSAAALSAVVIVGAIIGILRVRGPYLGVGSAALGRTQRAAFVRTASAVLVTLLVFGAAVLAHLAFPLWQGVSFLVAPSLSTAAGLAVFAVFPAVPIEGQVDRHIASLDRRNAKSLASPKLRWTFVSSTALSMAVIAACGSLSSAPPDGRFLCAAVFDVPCTVGGPYLFPGWYFGVPTAVAVVLLAASVALAFRRVAVSPGAAWPGFVTADIALRENAARLILFIGIAPMMLTTGMLLAAAGLPFLNAPVLNTGLTGDAAHWLSMLGLALLLAGGVALLAGLAFTVAAALSGISAGRLRRMPRDDGTSTVEQPA
ncbi:hypothetical protein [Parafrigoribacterium soli]|uniref:hypothetical protein n=1 Tax=Parafrigoribacterium soli TaxID=3144663 RepID=UPI0032ED51E0